MRCHNSRIYCLSDSSKAAQLGPLSPEDRQEGDQITYKSAKMMKSAIFDSLSS
jgi:hypothetical protein